MLIAPRRGTPVAIGTVAVVLGLACLACSESPMVPSERQAPHVSGSTTPREPPPHPDEYLARIADRNPGFAGFYMRGGTLVLRVKNAEAAAVTPGALRQALSADPDVGRFHGWGRALADAPVELEASRYNARELWEFRMRALRRVFGRGVHQLDLDESRGVIRLGVADAGDITPVARRVSAAGIPGDAVMIEVQEPIQPQATLRDRVRPVPGGVQIDVENGRRCTLTANGWMISSEAWGFLTCAHCTGVFGAAGGEAAYQNEEGSGNVMGGSC